MIDVRRSLLPEQDRATCLSGSLFNVRWCNIVKDRSAVRSCWLEACLNGFDESQVEQFFSLLPDNFPGAEIVLNAQSRAARVITNWVMRRSGTTDVATKWALKDVRKAERWDKHITVVDQFSAFKDFPRDPSWGIQVEWWMNFTHWSKTHNIFHLRVWTRAQPRRRSMLACETSRLLFPHSI